MRQILTALVVIASLATSAIGANADEHCGGFLQISCRDYELEKAERDEQYGGYDEEFEQEYEMQRIEKAIAADEWADTYLAAEKAVAVYWRNAYVERDIMNGKRTGMLGTPEGRFIYGTYVCDPNYDDAPSGGCVPSDRDYDCWELRSWGIVNIPIMAYAVPPRPVTGVDWMLLDDDHDGLGCEFQPTTP